MLGAFPLPVEVVRFGARATLDMVQALAADVGCQGEITLRRNPDGQPFITDNGNFIFDCAFGRIEEPELLDEALKVAPGVVEHGLFLGLADLAIIGTQEGLRLVEPDET